MTSAEKLVEKATSPLLLEPDLEAILNVCDEIRQGDVPPKKVIPCLKKRLSPENPNMNVTAHALSLLEFLVKNCGAPVHNEVFTKEFLETLRSLAKNRTEQIRGRVLDMLQTWANASAFKNELGWRSALQNVCSDLKHDGLEFPPLRADTFSEAIFAAENAPKWREASSCSKCQTTFRVLNRRHHCRNCGNSFCGNCTTNRYPIPKFGYEREVRVCDVCFNALKSGRSDDPSGASDRQLPTGAEHRTTSPRRQQSPTTSHPGPGGSTADPAELERLRKQEEEELQLAIALSQSEAEVKGHEKRTGGTSIGGVSLSSATGSAAGGGSLRAPGTDSSSEPDSELSKYLNRELWNMRAAAAANPAAATGAAGAGSGPASLHNGLMPSAPSMTPSIEQQQQYLNANLLASNKLTLPNGEMPAASIAGFVNGPPAAALQPSASLASTAASGGPPAGAPGGMGAAGLEVVAPPEAREFVECMRRTIDSFTVKMRSLMARGRPLASDTSIQALFQSLLQLHPRLLELVKRNEELRGRYEEFQEKFNEVHDARSALDGLRNEEKERQRREAEENARQNQLAMLQKLSTIRLKKQEYLERQRMEALAAVSGIPAAVASSQQIPGGVPYPLGYPVPGTMMGYGQQPPSMMQPAPNAFAPIAPAATTQGYSGAPAQPQPSYPSAVAGLPQSAYSMAASGAQPQSTFNYTPGSVANQIASTAPGFAPGPNAYDYSQQQSFAYPAPSQQPQAYQQPQQQLPASSAAPGAGVSGSGQMLPAATQYQSSAGALQTAASQPPPPPATSAVASSAPPVQSVQYGAPPQQTQLQSASGAAPSLQPPVTGMQYDSSSGFQSLAALAAALPSLPPGALQSMLASPGSGAGPTSLPAFPPQYLQYYAAQLQGLQQAQSQYQAAPQQQQYVPAHSERPPGPLPGEPLATDSQPLIQFD